TTGACTRRPSANAPPAAARHPACFRVCRRAAAEDGCTEGREEGLGAGWVGRPPHPPDIISGWFAAPSRTEPESARRNAPARDQRVIHDQELRGSALRGPD